MDNSHYQKPNKLKGIAAKRFSADGIPPPNQLKTSSHDADIKKKARKSGFTMSVNQMGKPVNALYDKKLTAFPPGASVLSGESVPLALRDVGKTESDAMLDRMYITHGDGYAS